MTALVLLALLVVTLSMSIDALLVMRTDTPAYSMGVWLNATANTPTLAVLDQALRDFPAATTPGGSDLALQLPSLTSPICFQEVVAIEQQIVNGINFRFHVTGCPWLNVVNGEAASARTTGKCVDDCGSSAESYQVTVFCQPWTNTAHVLNLVKEAQREVYTVIQ
uniref:Cystatin domain-containing protein n=1 Tax=Globisporangium ultimum (strain ATCC 200006 / CBS 805.95 / DAOM BR144) TaxID=431595 RepID=K3X3Q7_GLOUD